MITVVGSLNMDLVTSTERMPLIGETIFGLEFKQSIGGKGANQAAAIAKLGVSVSMLGKVGEDSYGNQIYEALAKTGVNVEGIKRANDCSSGIASIVVDGHGNNSIIVVAGANSLFNVKEIEEFDNTIKTSKILIAQLEIPIETVRSALEKARLYNVLTILNPAPAQILDIEMLRLVDILIPNETELQIMSQKNLLTLEDMRVAAEGFIKKGVKDVVVTLGAKGCMHVNRDGTDYYPAYKVDVVDTTAAGDSFVGGLASSILEGNSIKDALQFAQKVSALTVTKAGALESLPSRKEVDDWKEGVVT